MYTFESKIRFSETGVEDCLTLPGVVNYFQDCSTFQSEEMGYGLEYMRTVKRAWILSAWQVKVKRYPMLGEKIKVDTWSTGFDGLYGKRNFRMRDEQDQTLAWANALWVYMDLEKGRPIKPEAEIQRAYGAKPPLNVEFAPRKIRRPEQVEEREAFPVRRQQIDTNHHVNNCQYIQMALEVLPECGRVQEIRVEYKKSAVFGDDIYPKVAIETERKIVELCRADGELFAIVEIR